MVDMVTIGAGGGSIAKVDGSTLSVGPESAGAQPGPAAYGRGGTAPTVTDAHVVLGHLPARLLGGTMALDVEAARRAVADHVAKPLGLDIETAARGILAIADNHMVGAVRIVSVERGHDPRDFTLVPFGGAGPLHGCALAELLGIRRVMIPVAPGVLCADGLLAADLKAEFSRTLPKAGAVDVNAAEAILAELSARAAAWFDAEGVAQGDRRTVPVALLRYHGQGNELAVPWAGTRSELEANFAEQHRALYGFALAAPIELVTLRIEATGVAADAPASLLAPGGSPTPTDTAPVHFAGAVRDVPVYDRAGLGAGATFEGPAIVSQFDTTTLVPPGWSGRVHAAGAILLTRSGDPA